jgi:predicted DCC family thiol-disulfide oxidoreductase YuxK
MKQQPVILFDGICNFCNSAVNFTIKRDKKAIIQYAPLQTEKGRMFLRQYNLPTSEMKSFVFIEDGKAYTRSTAALRVCRYLRGIWPLCFALMIVPRFIRDGIYDWIAKHRYKWFGVRQECMMPTPDVRKRFLS